MERVGGHFALKQNVRTFSGVCFEFWLEEETAKVIRTSSKHTLKLSIDIT